jgi:uncharacterized membrane protein
LFQALSTADWAALAWLILVWLGYGWFADRLPADSAAPGNLNQMMHHLRRRWMRRMIDRPERIVDASLTGLSVNSTTFFASTSMLIIAGLLGVLGNAGDAYAVVQSFGFAARASQALFELKILGLVVIFILGFYKFTWALRQFNFAATLIGAAPVAPAPAETRALFADHAARVMSLAATSFNGGIRAYYFAMAWLAWFLHPFAFIAGTGIVLGVLVMRQLKSPSQEAVARYYAAVLDRDD